MLLWAIGLPVGVALYGLTGTHRHRRLARPRARRVSAAAAEAALDDPAFDEDTVLAEASWLFGELWAALEAGDPGRLEPIMEPELRRKWARRGPLRVDIVEGPRLTYVGLANRERDTEDRAVVLVEAKMRTLMVDPGGPVLGDDQAPQTLQEYWTLGKRDGRWALVAIEPRHEGKHRLDAPVVPTPWADGGLRDETLIELAAEDAVPAGSTVGDAISVEFAADARATALDLSLTDARFAPDVLEAVARRATDAWALAVEGATGPLEALATPKAAARLLHGSDTTGRTRVVVRGPRVKGIRIAGLDAQANPPRLQLEITIRGRRYAEMSGSGMLAHGRRWLARTFTERWTLALDGRSWRIVEAGPMPPPRPPSFGSGRRSGVSVLMLWAAALALGALLAISPAASAVRPPGGVVYVGSTDGGGNISFHVSADSRRVFDMQLRNLPGRCQGRRERLDFDPLPVALSPRGSFALTNVEGLTGEDEYASLQGEFRPGGRSAGRFAIEASREDCETSVRWTTRARRWPRAPRRIFTLAGSGPGVVEGGPAGDSHLGIIGGVDEQADGSLLVAGHNTGRVWRISPAGTISTVPGSRLAPYSAEDVAALPDGGMLVADGSLSCVWRIDGSGTRHPVAGSCRPTIPGPEGDFGFRGDGGPATAALLDHPSAVAATPDGGFLIADTYNQRIRRVTPDGLITTVAGSRRAAGFGGDGGPATLARLAVPADVEPLPDGGFLVADTGNERIRRVAPDGTISTVAGHGPPGFGGDGGPATAAWLDGPSGVSALPDGGFLIAESGGGRVRRVHPDGSISTIAGGGALGDGVSATLSALGTYRIAVTRDGGVAISDEHTLRFIPPRVTDRLAVALAGGRVIRQAGRPITLPVAATRAARIELRVRRGRRTVARIHTRIDAGRSSMRLPRGLRAGRYRVLLRATEASRVATARSTLLLR